LYRCIDIIIFPILDSNTHKTLFDKKKQQNGYIFFKSSTGEFPVFSGPVEFLNRSGPAGPVPALILLEYLELGAFARIRISNQEHMKDIFPNSYSVQSRHTRLNIMECSKRDFLELHG